MQETEPTFIPAKGWDVFNPTGGLVLVAICNPPRKFTHQQMMSLSLRDMAKIMSVSPHPSCSDACLPDLRQGMETAPLAAGAGAPAEGVPERLQPRPSQPNGRGTDPGKSSSLVWHAKCLLSRMAG